MNMKIVYIVPSLIQSGPIKVVYNIIKYLDRERFYPIVVTLHEPRLKNRDNRILFEELDVEIVSFSYSIWNFQFQTLSIARTINELYPESNVIFHAHGYYPTLILSKMKGRLVMNTIHNICNLDFRHKWGILLGSYLSMRYKFALRKLDLCVTISETMNKFYRNDNRLTLKVIYNGVEAIGYQSQEDRRRAMREHLNIDQDKKVLLYPAGFNKGKNHLYLISCLKKIKRDDFLILFAGQGNTELSCKQLVGSDNRFRFLGYCLDMEPYWMVADFMISSSLAEGMPMAVLEALLHGVPTLLSNIPPHLEILRTVWGDEGMSFSLNDEQSLIKLISSILDLQFDHEKILLRAWQFYSAMRMSESYSEIYESLLNS